MHGYIIYKNNTCIETYMHAYITVCSNNTWIKTCIGITQHIHGWADQSLNSCPCTSLQLPGEALGQEWTLQLLTLNFHCLGCRFRSLKNFEVTFEGLFNI